MRRLGLMLVTAMMASGLAAQEVLVSQPWARATVQGQKATGAFMTLKAAAGARLVGASSPVAGVVQIHEMAMDGGVMTMRALPKGLELPAGKTVELKPGGYHVMLMDLKQPLVANSTMALTLQVADAQGNVRTQEVSVPVRAPGPAAAASGMQHQH